jgi:hypothetical protein
MVVPSKRNEVIFIRACEHCVFTTQEASIKLIIGRNIYLFFLHTMQD